MMLQRSISMLNVCRTSSPPKILIPCTRNHSLLILTTLSFSTGSPNRHKFRAFGTAAAARNGSDAYTFFAEESVSWASLGVSDGISRALSNVGLHRPSLVQFSYELTSERMGRQLSSLDLILLRSLNRPSLISSCFFEWLPAFAWATHSKVGATNVVNISIFARSKSRGRKRERSTVRGNENGADDLDVDGMPNNKKMRLKSRSMSRSRSRSKSRPPYEVVPGEGLKDSAQKKAVKLAEKSHKKRNKDARKGEADRVIPTLKPKHLYSGKRSTGKTGGR